VLFELITANSHVVGTNPAPALIDWLSCSQAATPHLAAHVKLLFRENLL
jgi:hypothetical protein